MHIQHRIVQLCLALCCTLGILLGAWWLLPTIQPTSPNQGIGLRAPAFMNVVHAASDEATSAEINFLEKEAGISAYMNTGSEIDLDSTDKFFRSAIKRTDDYIIGPVIPPGYEELAGLEEAADVQVYIHKDGWIVAYLLAEQPASIIFDWAAYKSIGLTNTLERTVQRIANRIGASGDTWYYDFRDSNATNLMLIADMEEGDGQWDNFALEIPLTFVVSEASWSYAIYNDRGNRFYPSIFQINGEELSRQACRGCWALDVARIELMPKLAYEINIYRDGDKNKGASYGGIALIYREGK